MYHPTPILFCFFFALSSILMGRATDLHEHIIEAAEAVLSSRYAQFGTGLQVRVVRTGGVISSDKSLQVNWPPKAEIPRALLRVNVQSQNTDGEEQEGWALLYIAHFDSVMVLNRSVKNDEQLLNSDVSTAWMETTRFRGTPLTPVQYKKLKQRGPIYANRYVGEKRALKTNDLRNQYDVDTGQQVLMAYERRGVALELTCKSRNRGFLGDIIKLYSPDTQLMYKAEITGPQKAIWIETLE